MPVLYRSLKLCEYILCPLSALIQCVVYPLILTALLKWAGELPEGVGPLVPAELPADAVRDSGDKLSS